jgi:hypothetical protein
MTEQRLRELWGRSVYDGSGGRIGSLEEVFCEPASDVPAWIGIGVGFLGTRLVLAPADRVVEARDGIAVPYPADLVKEAPELYQDDLDDATLDELRHHYADRLSRRGCPA